MMKIKPVAVILLNWNTPHHTIACIHSFIKYNSRETFDMIVVDNGSTDGSLERIKHHFPDLIYIDNKTNLGFAEGNNNALKYSLDNGYSYSLILNNDTQVEEDIISPMLVHLNNNTDVGAVQPVIYSLANRHRLWNGGAYFNPLFGITYSKKKPVNEVKKVDWVTGCCFLVRNEALKKAGLFNPLYFLYYEDTELSFRIKEAGYELHFLPVIKIYHEGGVSGKTKAQKKEGYIDPVIHYYNLRNRIWFLRKYSRLPYFPFVSGYQSIYYISVLLYFIIRRRWQKASFLLKAIKDGLFTPLAKIYEIDK